MNAHASSLQSKFMPDFMNTQGESGILWAYGMQGLKEKKRNEKKEIAARKKGPNPKKVFDLRMLNDKSFAFDTSEKYVDEQLQHFKDKLEVLKVEEFDMANGTTEIASIVLRMENRKKYSAHEKFFSQYPYTTQTKVSEVLKKHSYLKQGKVAQFLADMPKDATDVMKKYDAECVKLCGKKAVFYIIADKKDFQKTEQRRDPILLAQSPFGHFWQILGAWDKEMLLLEEL